MSNSQVVWEHKTKLPTLESRKNFSKKLRDAYPDRVPVIVQVAPGNTMVLNQTKFLAPDNVTLSRMLLEIRKHLILDGQIIPPEKAIFLFIGSLHILPPMSRNMLDLHNKYGDEDGMLYLQVATESVFG